VSPHPYIPLVNLKIQETQIRAGVEQRWQEIISETSFIGGSAVSNFESEFAAFAGVRHCIGVANGGDAIELILRALDISYGHEVIIPANTFVATAMAVQRVGAVPVPVDVDQKYHLLDPGAIEEAITPQTRAIIPVHLFGQIAPMDQIVHLANKWGIHVLEDAAQCQGATQNGKHAGSFGIAAATSFYPGKNLGAYGDGGAVLTNSDELAERIMRIRNYGGIAKYEHTEYGYNSRLDSLQAAVLSEKLTHLDSWNLERRNVAEQYRSLLGDVDGLTLPEVWPENDHVWHLFVIKISKRDFVLQSMMSCGIGVGIHYPTTVNKLPAFVNSKTSQSQVPIAERLADEILSLPIFPGIQEKDVDYISQKVREIVQ
jgi:dTDP-4-amino-4,6-dideoxygalactose transaminase